MKRVMQQFVDRTTQRFHEYDERMKTTRQKCKDKCHKEIEKIILKDKLEKELNEKLLTLQTDIQSDSIPTCICEKSLEDKMEKECLKCAQNLGGIVAPSTGVLGEIAALAVNAWKTTEIAAVIAAAEKAGAAAGLKAGNAHGMKVATHLLEQLDLKILGIDNFGSFFSKEYIIDIPKVVNIIATKRAGVCGASGKNLGKIICNNIDLKLGTLKPDGTNGPPVRLAVEQRLNYILEKATSSANAQAAKVAATKTAALEAKNIAAVEATTTPYYTPIIVSIVAIVVIILIMVIIYLILRYRRKKKMKKKLQYIKLLEE
ncbi:hypothetical protein PFNF135_03793 [Plasmodium falciparum NF135/5.C10]|uniref:Surface antigen n=1 Tax=Plasmodium falciparum NF135/5.C10 TaxID=1036726 RepID=W4ID79_PLAFA|nr:hypothetical protein PFNF135_03793 [Plasmodium falciparum NF135/5.C10]